MFQPKLNTRPLKESITIQFGFTLIELMVTIAIIGIMASLALPEYQKRVQSEKVQNAVGLTNSLKIYIDKYFQHTQSFPSDNISAGLPPADKLLSPEVSRIEVTDGAFHIELSESAHQALKGKIISVRPVYVAGSPKSPISWICGNASIPKGMSVSGKNKTNVPYTMLPIECQDISGLTARNQSQS